MQHAERGVLVIVDPDFTEHWKIRMLVGLLEGDEVAPVYVLRLWAHCQNRRQDTFDNLTPEALKALCRFPGNANKLDSSLVTSGFIRRNEKTIKVLNWADYNASLLAAWKNGTKGGRPTKPLGSKSKTQDKPTGSRVEKSREDESRVEKKLGDKSPKAPRDVKRFAPPMEEEVAEFCRNRGNSVDAEAFVNFYQSKGWKVGSQP